MVGSFGLVSELVSGLYVVPVLRLPVTIAVLSLHAGIVLLMGYVEPEWWLVMVALTALTWPF